MVLIKSYQQNKRQLVNKQKMESNKRARRNDNDVELGMLFQNQNIGPMIGKGGENINSIREESGAVVTTSKFVQGAHERTAKIIGSVEQVSTAIKLVIDKVCKDHPMITLLAEHSNCGFLIGKKGVTIKEIREETGANIHVKKECIGNSTQKEISINGDKAAVSKAIDAVVMHLAQGNNPTRMAYVAGGGGGFSNLGMGFSNTAPSRGGWVLPPTGRGGLPFQQSSFVNVLGRQSMFGGGAGGGPSQQGGAGTSMVRMEMTLWVPKEVIGKVIGRAGSTIRTVREQSTAHVYVHKAEDDDDSSERKITIKGNMKSIGAACAIIESLVMG